MALFTRLRVNSQFGVLDTEADGATDTLSSPEFAGLPEVGAGQFLALIIDPEKEHGAVEIVYVTAHAAGATTVTIKRNVEGSSTRVHPVGTVWRHGPTAWDFGGGFYVNDFGVPNNSVVFGDGAQDDEDGVGNVVIGAGAAGNGAHTVIIGEYAWASSAQAYYATAVGDGTEVAENSATALGSRARGLHVHSTALGAAAVTDKNHQVKLGTADEVTTLGGGLEVPIRTVTAAASVGVGDRVVLVDASGGPVVITLPVVAGNTGRVVTVKKVDTSTNEVTVDGNGAETIDGQAAQALSVQYEDLTVVCDGTAWFII